MADEFEQYKVSSGDEFAQYKVSPSSTPMQSQMRQHFEAANAYDAGVRSSAQKMVPRTPMHDYGQTEFLKDLGNMAVQPLRDAATLTRAGYQSMLGGRMAHDGQPGKAGLIGTPPPQDQFMSAAQNIGTGMLMGLPSEGVPPTARLNQALNKVKSTVPISDPGFGLARKLAREIPGVGGYLRKADLFKDIMNRVGGQAESPAPTPVTLPPEAPEILRQGWALKQGGQSAPAAETGEALANVPRGTQVVNNASEYQAVPLKVPQAKAPVNPYSGSRTPAMEPSQSTTIAQHGYHPESQTMVVQFKNGNVYEYRGVPQEVFDAYKSSESQGSYFANNIKGRYTTNLRGNAGTPGAKVRKALGGQP